MKEIVWVNKAIIILKTLEKRGCSSKSRTILYAFKSRATSYYHIINELNELGAIEITQLKGSRTLISINTKGRQILKKWRKFAKELNGFDLND